MKSIFNSADNRETIARIEGISENTIPLWGKMSAGQMMVHCQAPLKVATGELKIKRNLVGILFGSWAKKVFLGPKEYGKNMPTVKEFKITHSPEFEKEKNTLIELVRQFEKMGPAVLANKTHPFFGTMNDAEWGHLQWRHLDHHLRQFGR